MKQTVSGAFHGGDLADAAALSRGTGGEANWLDLSTGIAPRAYPVPDLPGEVWSRLPGRNETGRLIAAAAKYYGAPGRDHVVAGPGSQALIERLPALFPASSVAIAGPTYGGHGPAWERAGHEVRNVSALEETAADEIVILVNPNNPDGRVVPRDDVGFDAVRRIRADGWLIVDEAFGDVAEEAGTGALCTRFNVISLRSFGKFFGLAGLRLGFAIAPQNKTARLRETLGPWPVSGPAIEIGIRALEDIAWQKEQRELLTSLANRLDALLENAGIPVSGGTSLFRFVRHSAAHGLFRHLLEHRIYVRSFDVQPEWLRIGVPGRDEDFSRLETVLGAFVP